jgi:DNA-binding SARP family transcriptional activator/TolB-like protein
MQLLGPFALTNHEGSAAGAPSRFVQAMLAYIVLAPRECVSREKLAAVIWEDRADEQARHSLRQALLALRRFLGADAGAILQAESDAIAISSDTVDIDVRSFEVAVAQHDRPSLEYATELYRGELLEGLSIRGDAFGNWLAAERRRLSERALDAMRRLALLQRGEGDHAAAIETLRRILTIDPFRESSMRQLMQTYVDAGRRADALREFKNYAEQLRKELRTAPEPATVALFESVRRSGIDLPDPEALTEPASIAESAPTPDEAHAAMSEADRRTLATPAATLAAETGPLPAQRMTPRQWVIASAVALLMVLTAGGTIFWNVLILRPGPVGGVMRTIRAGLLLADRPSIVVLPFEVHGSDTETVMLADGIGDGITTGLSIVSEMLVIDRRSAMSYEDRAIPVSRVADELGVRYCLIGSVQRRNDHVRISMQLVDAAIGSSVWAATFDHEVSNVFELQDQITLEVITALQVEITEGEQERISLQHGTDNLQAWFHAARGMKLLRRVNAHDTLLARELYERAIAIDPNYPGAYEGLAWTHYLEARFGWVPSPEGAIAEAFRLAQIALAMDTHRARTHSLLGALHLLTGDLEGAIAAGERAIELAPNGAEDAALFAYTLTYADDAIRAISLAEQAKRLSPEHPDWYDWVLGRAYRLNGDYGDAIEALLAGNAGSGPSIPPRVELAVAYAGIGRISNAQQIAAEIMELAPDFSIRGWVERMPYADFATAEREIELLRLAGLPE